MYNSTQPMLRKRKQDNSRPSLGRRDLEPTKASQLKCTLKPGMGFRDDDTFRCSPEWADPSTQLRSGNVSHVDLHSPAAFARVHLVFALSSGQAEKAGFLSSFQLRSRFENISNLPQLPISTTIRFVEILIVRDVFIH